MPSSSSTDVVVASRVALPRSGTHAVVVKINRPDRLNCFDTEVCRRLAFEFGRIADSVERREKGRRTGDGDDDGGDGDDDEFGELAAVILTGEGSSFCAGADLSDPPDPVAQSSDLPHRLAANPVHQMSRVGVPIIAALRGHVITGGFELALACDILIGDTTTKFRDTHVKFGLAPCWGLSQKLQRKISPGRAKILSFTARPLPALIAYEWGLLDEIVLDGADVLERALEMADAVGCNDTGMVRRYKRAIVEGGMVDLGKGLQRERELGIAHYVEAVGDGMTFEGAKEFISDDGRPRIQSKM